MKNQKEEKWFNPKVEDTGWDKETDPDYRRYKMLKAHHFNNLQTAQALQALVNVTKDAETKKKAQSDADYFYSLYHENVKKIEEIKKHPATKFRDMRITPKDVRITPKEVAITPRERKKRC